MSKNIDLFNKSVGRQNIDQKEAYDPIANLRCFLRATEKFLVGIPMNRKRLALRHEIMARVGRKDRRKACHIFLRLYRLITICRSRHIVRKTVAVFPSLRIVPPAIAESGSSINGCNSDACQVRSQAIWWCHVFCAINAVQGRRVLRRNFFSRQSLHRTTA